MNIHTGLARVAAVIAMALLSACNSSDDEEGGDAKIRLLNLSTGYPALDLITNLDADDDDEDETQAESVALETTSEYVTLDSDDYTIKLKRTGSGSILRSFTGEALVEGTVNTYVAFGEVGAFGALRIDDTQDPADSGETKLSVANLSSAGALDVYITDSDTELDDTTPVLSGVGPALNAFSTDSGTYRLRVTASGDNSDVRLDISAFELPDRGIVALILTSSQGGTLANAVYLPQEGQPAKLLNTKARLRGAVGLANGANASIQSAGRSVLSTATAGVIGSRYTLLDSGSLPLTVRVNGAEVAVPDISLQAGADYTLLVWGAADDPQTSLIVDDNRLPSSSANTKLRLLNGMSTLAAPLTLSMDFSPLIEGTLTGQVSEPIEVSSGTDRQFDLANTSTAMPVLTRGGITLQPNSVYTFLMTDNGATPIGVLRRDR
ncbi:MAG TPA: DUF4397 domain-containing protein [Steroidobacteraceae bacterium]|nr:DUF4397 domain-containing protein [Steroidobacteraceae bacterium]